MTDPLSSWQRADTEPLTVADILGEPEPPRTDWIARQRAEALVRERGRRVDAQDALSRLLRAVEAHREAIPLQRTPGRPTGRSLRGCGSPYGGGTSGRWKTSAGRWTTHTAFQT